MGTFFELEKAKTAKGEGWAPPFISCAQDKVGLTPTPPMAIRLRETFTFLGGTVVGKSSVVPQRPCKVAG